MAATLTSKKRDQLGAYFDDYTPYIEITMSRRHFLVTPTAEFNAI